MKKKQQETKKRINKAYFIIPAIIIALVALAGMT